MPGRYRTSSAGSPSACAQAEKTRATKVFQSVSLRKTTASNAPITHAGVCGGTVPTKIAENITAGFGLASLREKPEPERRERAPRRPHADLRDRLVGIPPEVPRHPQQIRRPRELQADEQRRRHLEQAPPARRAPQTPRPPRPPRSRSRGKAPVRIPSFTPVRAAISTAGPGLTAAIRLRSAIATNAAGGHHASFRPDTTSMSGASSAFMPTT